jgi:hypothetical protein
MAETPPGDAAPIYFLLATFLLAKNRQTIYTIFTLNILYNTWFFNYRKIRQDTLYLFIQASFSPKIACFHLNISFALTAPHNLR